MSGKHPGVGPARKLSDSPIKLDHTSSGETLLPWPLPALRLLPAPLASPHLDHRPRTLKIQGHEQDGQNRANAQFKSKGQDQASGTAESRERARLLAGGLHKQPPQRRRVLVNHTGQPVDFSRLTELPGQGVGDGMIENFIGFMALPLGVATNFLVDGEPTLLPMAIQEPSVIAAASSAAKFIATHGGFKTFSGENLVIGQVQLVGIHSPQAFDLQFQGLKPKLRQVCEGLLERMTQRGGGLRAMRWRYLPAHQLKSHSNQNMAVVEVVVDVCEAMGANLVNQVCERVGEFLEAETGARHCLRVISNYSTERVVSAWFEVREDALQWKGVRLSRLLLQAYEFALRDVHRAVTHNKGIMNGVDGVLVALGQDWRAVEAGAHAYAARSGVYQPLSHYHITEVGGVRFFRGEIQLPMSVGTVGGAISKNPAYRETLKLAGSPSSKRVGQLAAVVGLAQNFAALRAMVVEGIQKGHMSLHLKAKL